NAESLGARVIRCAGVDGLRAGLEEAKRNPGTVVLYVEVDRYAEVPSYESWWDVPVAEVSGVEAVREARAGYEQGRARERPHLGSRPSSSGASGSTCTRTRCGRRCGRSGPTLASRAASQATSERVSPGSGSPPRSSRGSVTTRTASSCGSGWPPRASTYAS